MVSTVQTIQTISKMLDQTYRWYPVTTRSRAEKKAYEELINKNITAYLPLRKTLKQWSDRKKWVEEPLIKSYVFVYISAQEHAEVLMCHNIARFLYFSGQVASIPDKQLDDLKLLLASGEELEVLEQDFKTGEKVRIKAGPFMGIVAELLSLQNKQRIVLRLTNMGFAINIKTSMAYIERMT